MAHTHPGTGTGYDANSGICASLAAVPNRKAVGSAPRKYVAGATSVDIGPVNQSAIADDNGDDNSDDKGDQHTSYHTLQKRSSSMKLIFFYSSLICLPLLALSVILLALVYLKKVGSLGSSQSEVPGGFYLVDFPAARLMFVSSWSSSVAPLLVSVATGLYLFQTSRVLIEKSIHPDSSGLPTSYEVALLLGLSSGSPLKLAKYLLHCFTTKIKSSPLLR